MHRLLIIGNTARADAYCLPEEPNLNTRYFINLTDLIQSAILVDDSHAFTESCHAA